MAVSALTQITDPAACPRLVLKVGSALLVGQGGQVRRGWLAALAGEIAEAGARGQQVVVVSSGAIALGAARLGLAEGGRATLADAQAAAAVGQIALSSLWAELLAVRGLTAAQLLLTLDDLEDRRRYLNAASTLGRLLESGAVPVVNENDSVATAEIRFGDNDRLAARVAQAAGADAVILLSDVDGLYDRDPADLAARLLPEVHKVDAAVRGMATAGSRSGLGSGGMVSKVQAAEIAGRAGIALAIVNGTHERPIARSVALNRGTLFLPRRRDAGRKAWLGGRIARKGVLTVDRGCRSALESGASLLAAGIIRVEGEFARGDVVGVAADDATLMAQGLVEYSAIECRAIAGRRAAEQEALLGYAPRAAVVHRDHLVML